MDGYIILCGIALGELYIIESQIYLCVMELGGEAVVNVFCIPCSKSAVSRVNCVCLMTLEFVL